MGPRLAVGVPVPLLTVQTAAASSPPGGGPTRAPAPERPFSEVLDEQADADPIPGRGSGVDAREAADELDADAAAPVDGAPGVPCALLPVPAALLPVPAALLPVPAALLPVPAAQVEFPAAQVEVPAAQVEVPAAPGSGGVPGEATTLGARAAGPIGVESGKDTPLGAHPDCGPPEDPQAPTPDGGATPASPATSSPPPEGAPAAGRPARPAKALAAHGAPAESTSAGGRRADVPTVDGPAARGAPAAVSRVEAPPPAEAGPTDARADERGSPRGEELQRAAGSPAPQPSPQPSPAPTTPFDLTSVTHADAPRAAAPAAPSAPGEAAPIVEQVRFVLGPGVSEARIDLAPAELGAVSVRIVLRDGALSARLEASTPVGRLTLEKHRAELEVALAIDGVAARVEVVAPAERPPDVAPPSPRAEPALDGAQDGGSRSGGGARGDSRGDAPPPRPGGQAADATPRLRPRRASSLARLDTLA